jgi:uncharacterized protein YdeI (YjbR/CyaY-like superfamily)
MATRDDAKIAAFPSAKEWRRWLAKNHADPTGVWLRFFKKGSGVASLTHAQALDDALCYGWIDGPVKKHDEESWLHKFLPRRPKSLWSKRNREIVERLAETGRMMAAGWKEVAEAKADGRWDKAYDPPSKMTMPEDFLKELSRNQKALRFFGTLNKANTYAIAWRLQTAKKPETRGKRMKAIIGMLASGKPLHESKRKRVRS